MTRHLWPTCIQFTPLYLSYMPLSIYSEPADIFTIRAASQTIKEHYSESDVLEPTPFYNCHDLKNIFQNVTFTKQNLPGIN